MTPCPRSLPSGKARDLTAAHSQRTVSVLRLRERGRAFASAAAAHVGLNVIVDEVVIDRTSWDDWAVALAGLEVVWVGVRCSAEVAEERNRARGDRFAGLARALTATVHRHVRYDFEIDTTTQTPDEVLAQLTDRLGY